MVISLQHLHSANIGSLCNIEVATGKKVKAEIVAISQEQVEILPYETNTNIRVGNEITLIEDGGRFMLERLIGSSRWIG